MAAQIRNTYISGTMIDSIEIPTAILGVSTMSSSNEVFPVSEAILLFPVVGRSRNHFLWTRHGQKPQVCRSKHTFVVRLLKLVGDFFLPQAQHVCVKIEAHYEG